ncbi:MAG TPA: folylpolyglutamate synthase/dihydrofolate synthase family protein [Candidatus Acidoferrum sp.]|nr:folylpolyglutamate synthase/dihydrofolate synthase family protein [Candidatus Acidoferrum sp.]
MNYEESVRSLYALGRELASPQQARVQKFGLENIRVLCAALGNPHLAAPCMHVAGTNGKGSTAAMIESILRAAGFRTGLYTSPHLERINERIRIDGDEISDEAFANAWTRVQASIESLLASGNLAAHPTFFECVTAMAFVAFADKARAADAKRFFAVYEVGLGGRLDSTNIVQPEVAVITPIDFDHENFLGHSIEEIAGEKAGIIKRGVPVVSAPQRPEARAVIARRAAECGTKLVEVTDVWRVGNLTSRDGFYRATASRAGDGVQVTIAPSLPGKFQVQNALTAATTAFALREGGFAITDEDVEAGISSARWPGRLERLSGPPSGRAAIYLDGAHNPAAARELKTFWEENFAGRRIHLIYGAMRDKAVDEVAGLLFPMAENVILTQPQQSRAISAQHLAEIVAGLARHADVVRDPARALERAIADAGPNDVIFVTGSLFLVGDIRRYWLKRGEQGSSASASNPQR